MKKKIGLVAVLAVVAFVTISEARRGPSGVFTFRANPLQTYYTQF